MSADLKLNAHQRLDPIWAAIEAHLAARLAMLRAQNDNPAMSAEETQAQRGRIAEVKKLLRIGAPADEQDDE